MIMNIDKESNESQNMYPKLTRDHYVMDKTMEKLLDVQMQIGLEIRKSTSGFVFVYGERNLHGRPSNKALWQHLVSKPSTSRYQNVRANVYGFENSSMTSSRNCLQ